MTEEETRPRAPTLNPDIERCTEKLVNERGMLEGAARKLCIAAAVTKAKMDTDAKWTSYADCMLAKGRDPKVDDPDAECIGLATAVKVDAKPGKEPAGSNAVTRLGRELRAKKLVTERVVQKDDCMSSKVSAFKSEGKPQSEAVAAAVNWCRTHGGKSTDEIVPEVYTYFISELAESRDALVSTLSLVYGAEAHAVDEETPTCYKMENVTETEDEYIVPVVLARAMVQDYPEKGMAMAKLPENLAKFKLMDYKTGMETDQIPYFEHHPMREVASLEVGYIDTMFYQDEHERIVGVLHAVKARMSDNMRGYFERREQVGVSIGFGYTVGAAGNYDGTDYGAAQENIVITHLAGLSPNEATGRCPIDLCSVGKTIDAAVPKFGAVLARAKAK